MRPVEMPESQPDCLPHWWKAWKSIAQQLKCESIRLTLADPVRDGLEKDGIAIQNLSDWRPNARHREILDQIDSLVLDYRLLVAAFQDPVEENRIRQAIFAILDHQIAKVPGADLRRLVQAYLKGCFQTERGRSPTTDYRKRTTKLAVVRPDEFEPDATQLTIYFDENVATHEDSGAKRFAFGGLVWKGHDPSERDLLRIGNHARERYSLDRNEIYLKRCFNYLLECPRCFPFFFQAPVGRSVALDPSFIKSLFDSSLEILLGWLLPNEGQPCQVRVVVDRNDSLGWRPAEDLNLHLETLLRGAKQRDHRRFARWQHLEFVVAEKGQDYLGWADLVAYLNTKESARSIAQWSEYWQLPGYARLDPDFVDLLFSSDPSLAGGDVGSLMRLADRGFHKTKLGGGFFDFVARANRNNGDWKLRLLDALNKSFRAKRRDMSSLGQRLRAAGYIMGNEPPAKASVDLKFLWSSVKLQHANHLGSPAEAETALNTYERLSEKYAFRNPNLMAFMECNLAVHYSDCFDPAAATGRLDRLAQVLDLDKLDPQTIGMILSARGQLASFQQRYLLAETLFVEALANFRRAEEEGELSPAQSKGEQEQTSVYRAINAIDGEFSEATERTLEALDIMRLEPAARRFAEAQSNHPESHHSYYHHHLFLRLLYFAEKNNAEISESCEQYLEHQPFQGFGHFHPWELILLYRGLLLNRRDFRIDAEKHFWQAIELSAGNRQGPTVALIGGMIGAAGYKCLGSNLLKTGALAALQRVQNSGIPGLIAAKATLQKALHNPEEWEVEQILRTLPFNYH